MEQIDLDFETAKKLCQVLDEQGKKIVITKRGSDKPYLVRYIIQRSPEQSVYIHRFLSSDDATLHDHPWDGTTTIISGEYTEQYMITKWDDKQYITERRCVTGDHNEIGGHRIHRIQLDKEYTEDDWDAPMTLFICGPRYKSWGFYEFEYGGRSWKFTNHREYLED